MVQDSQAVPQPKKGIFKRIFGRGKQGGEHESFSNFAQYAPQERAREESGQNIVILNSLTHSQLMELLKVAHSSFLPATMQQRGQPILGQFLCGGQRFYCLQVQHTSWYRCQTS